MVCKEQFGYLPNTVLTMKNLIILLCIISVVHVTFAQSEKLQAMEEELVFVQNTANEMWRYIYNSNYNNDENYLIHSYYSDIINLLCVQFENMLNQMFIEDKDMTCSFASLQSNGLLGTHIVLSTDSLLRVFSWMLPGGTQHFYGNAIQYKNADLTVHSISFENEYNQSNDDYAGASYEYDTVYTLKDNNKTIYILSGSTQASTRIVAYQLIAFCIRDELIEYNIFEDENGNITNKINISYEIGCSNISYPFPRPTIDVNKKNIYLPEITENCFTGKFIEYKIIK